MWQVTAPVRETAAQALGTALLPLKLPALKGVVGLLRQLMTAAEWEARHGGLLALKYLLAARSDSAAQLLPDALPAAITGLQVRGNASHDEPQDCSSGLKLQCLYLLKCCRWLLESGVKVSLCVHIRTATMM